MKPPTNLIALLRCPFDQSMLHGQVPPSDATELEATGLHLVCKKCLREYPFVDGVVRFLGAGGAGLDNLLKHDEMVARDAAARVYDERISTLRRKVEITASLRVMSPQPNDVVVELGCGTGRVTRRYASLVSGTIAIDFSLESLLICRRSLSPDVRGRVLLVQADICSPPLQHSVFTKAVSFQVLEHIPTPESRRQVANAVAGLLMPSGTFTCSVYNWSISKQRRAALGIGDNTLKEGFHDTGIYYYNFDETELRSLLQEVGFKVESVRGLIIPFRGARLLGPLRAAVDRLLSTTSVGKRRAHLLLTSSFRRA